MKRALLALGILLVVAAPARAQQDEEGCKDHPAFPRMASFFISDCDSEEPSSFDFEKPGGSVTVAGHYWKIDYWRRDDAPQPAPLQIARKYWNLMAAQGGTRLLERVDSSGVLLTARMPGPKGSGTLWLQVHVPTDGEVYSLIIVQEKGMR
jgi:hypothetical protein